MFSATDTQRSLRAYEVKMFTNKSIYEWISNTKSDFLDFDMRKIFINIPKERLLKNQAFKDEDEINSHVKIIEEQNKISNKDQAKKEYAARIQKKPLPDWYPNTMGE